jgi:hypothetical protein
LWVMAGEKMFTVDRDVINDLDFSSRTRCWIEKMKREN